MAASKKGYLQVGLNPILGAVLAAKRLAKRLVVPFQGVVADARFLPFHPAVSMLRSPTVYCSIFRNRMRGQPSRIFAAF